MKRFRYLFVLFAAVLLVISACSNSNETGGSSKEGDGDKKATYNWKIGINTPEGSVRDVVAKRFKEIVEEKSDGRVSIEIFPNEVLGSEQEMIESVQVGALDFQLVSSGSLSNIVPEDALLSLPFIVSNFEEAHAVLDGPVGEDFLKPLYEEQGLKVLSFTDLGFTQITSNKPINTPEDLKGMKMRSPNEPINIETFEALGANVVTLPFTEVYLGLQQGIVEAQFNPLDAIYESSFHEVQVYLAMTNHVYYYISFVINNDLFNGLDPELQKIVQEAADEAKLVGREFAAEKDKEMLDVLKDEFKEITYPDQKQFQEKIQPAYKEFEKIIPKESIEKVQTFLEEYRS